MKQDNEPLVTYLSSKSNIATIIMCKKKQSVLYACLFFISLVLANDPKSSMTFVIDDTGSMSDDIDHVVKSANDIFDAVLNSNSSQIEDFVLVTFNDPDIKYRITTRDRQDFKYELSSIDVGGGADCPEMAMQGIARGLHESKPYSYLYVFTDASAKDYEYYGQVKEMAQKKQSQIVFVLTGNCDFDYPSQGRKVYDSLADDTSGQVFNLYKNEVGEILKYVMGSVKDRKTDIARKRFPSGTHSLNYKMDGTMKEVVISVSGENPQVSVHGPDGYEADTEDIVKTNRIAIVKVKGVTPGTYKVEVSSDGDTSVVVAGTTNVNFQYGFSGLKPTSLEGTATRPIPDKPSYLGIQLNLGKSERSTVKLESMQILDMDNIIVLEQPLSLVDEFHNFYVCEPFNSPNIMFRVAIKGFDAESKTEILRISMTPVQPQTKQDPVKIKNRAPQVLVFGESKLVVEYNDPLELKCKIDAHPAPSIVWKDDEGNIFPSQEAEIEIAKEYLSIFKVDKSTRNTTYTCEASNYLGKESGKLQVETKITPHLRVLVEPKDTVIEYGKFGRFECKVDANPPAFITWYKGHRELVNSRHIDISPDKSTLIIKNVVRKHQGNYFCEARNLKGKKLIRFQVTVSGYEAPVIKKTTYEIRVQEGSDANITCRIAKGKPRPQISWYFRHKTARYSDEVDAKNREILQIDDVVRKFSGTYMCEAQNAVGRDTHATELIVEYSPTIKTNSDFKRVIEGEKLSLSCIVNAEPVATVKWLFNNTVLNSSRYSFTYPYSMKNPTYSLNIARPSSDDSGYYSCLATNRLGSAQQNIKVEFSAPASIEPPPDSRVYVKVGTDVTLPCHSKGDPRPDIKWELFGADSTTAKKTRRVPSADGTLKLPRIQMSEQGFYTCTASNRGGSSNITYEVKVLAPPMIQNVYPEKAFTGVVGDVALRIPCKATGNPKPEISWMKERNHVASGPWYDFDEDGWLIIKNLDKESAGVYMCIAKNTLGEDSDAYEVIVEAYPSPSGRPTSTVTIEEGDTKTIPCGIPYKPIDQLRWFKNGVLVAKGKLTLKNAKYLQSGFYTCRVSDFVRSKSELVAVLVGSKPKFAFEETGHIDFIEGEEVVMDCSADGEPKPEVTWWHNGEKLLHTGMEFNFIMQKHNKGNYNCLVENVFGNIIRYFGISSNECLIDIGKDFKENQPFILTPDSKWLPLVIKDEFVSIPRGDSIRLFCEHEFKDFETNSIMATCDNNSFIINNDKSVLFKFSDIQCKQKASKPIKRSTKISCGRGFNIFSVGYEISSDEFLEVYQICYDTLKNKVAYAKHSMSKSLANRASEKPNWNEYLSSSLMSLYNCSYQNTQISNALGRPYHTDDMCCFSKRQLVNPRDVLPGLQQKTTYYASNIVAQWSSCNTKNWEIVEERVREMAKTKTSETNLEVYTGVSQQIVSIGHWQFDVAPQYLWKVIQDPSNDASLAIIQINVPDLTSDSAYRFIRCRDICHEISWLSRVNWRDVINGYTFCCSISDFEKAFDFNGDFKSDRYGKVLSDVI